MTGEEIRGLIGIILLCMPNILPVVFTIVIGIWMIASSINYIRIAVKISGTKLPWIQILLLGMLDLIVGLVMIFNPFEATVSLAVFSGIMLIVHSIINIVDMIIIKKDAKEISKTLKNILKETEKTNK